MSTQEVFWTVILAGLGLADVGYLTLTQRRGKKVICFLGEHCEQVLQSRFGRLLWLRNEVWGALFYLGVLFLVLLWSISRQLFFFQLVRWLTLSAALVSLLLLYLMFGVLKSRCSWCIASAVINFLLLGLVF